jgi:hypothetical protein
MPGAKAESSRQGPRSSRTPACRCFGLAATVVLPSPQHEVCDVPGHHRSRRQGLESSSNVTVGVEPFMTGIKDSGESQTESHLAHPWAMSETRL